MTSLALQSRFPLPSLRHGPASQRSNPHGARLSPKTRAVIDCEPLLVLPLVHHLVEESVERLFPAIAPDVPSAQNDLGLIAIGRRAVVSEPAFHTARHANRHFT